MKYAPISGKKLHMFLEDSFSDDFLKFINDPLDWSTVLCFLIRNIL